MNKGPIGSIQIVLYFSNTHARFSSHFESFLKYAENTVLWIEEVHEFLAVGDAGSVPYGFGTGYRSGFDAKVALRFIEWMKINGRVLAFTATPTLISKSMMIILLMVM